MSNGCACVGREKRCENTTWMQSPSTMYSLMRRTLASYSSRDMLEQISGFGAAAGGASLRYGSGASGWGGRVGRLGHARLEVPDDLVAEIADGAAVEARQALHRRDTEARELLLDER